LLPLPNTRQSNHHCPHRTSSTCILDRAGSDGAPWSYSPQDGGWGIGDAFGLHRRKILMPEADEDCWRCCGECTTPGGDSVWHSSKVWGMLTVWTPRCKVLFVGGPWDRSRWSVLACTQELHGIGKPWRRRSLRLSGSHQS
jgi:hypothetical protein